MKIGITCSCFDLFHSGHVLMLEEAKEHCDFLIAALQTDPTIDRPEKNKPVQDVYERWSQLNACKYVDKIIPYSTESDLYNLLLTQKIDIRFVGEEYESKTFTGKYMPGIEIYYNRREHNYSSSGLRERIMKG